MYKIAQRCHGYYCADSSTNQTFFYDGANLKFRVWFETKDKAENFQNMLTDMNENHSYFASVCEYESDITCVSVDKCSQRIMSKDYNTAEIDESPYLSLNDFKSISDSSIVDGDASEYAHQSVENLDYWKIFGLKFHRCCLIDKHSQHAKHIKFRNNPDNFIYGSVVFHDALDGMNTVHGEVSLVVLYEEYLGSEDILIEGNYQRRDKISVIIQFRSRETASPYGKFLKFGTEKIDEYRYRSFLYAQNYEIMKYCLGVKYQNCHWDEDSDVAEEV